MRTRPTWSTLVRLASLLNDTRGAVDIFDATGIYDPDTMPDGMVPLLIRMKRLDRGGRVVNAIRVHVPATLHADPCVILDRRAVAEWLRERLAEYLPTAREAFGDEHTYVDTDPGHGIPRRPERIVNGYCRLSGTKIGTYWDDNYGGPDGEYWVQLPGCSWSEYHGSTFDRANALSVVEQWGGSLGDALYVDESAFEGGATLYVKANVRLPVGMANAILNLTDYPLLDDETHSQVEMDIEHECWESFGLDEMMIDVTGVLMGAYGDVVVDQLCEIDALSDRVTALFWAWRSDNDGPGDDFQCEGADSGFWRRTKEAAEWIAGRILGGIVLPVYVATVNVPGYPSMNDEPARFTSAKDAWQHLSRERSDDESGTTCDGTCEYGAACRWHDDQSYSPTVRSLAEMTECGTVYGATPGYHGSRDLGLAYSVQLEA